ncbi:MAG TPA: hypothetical protein VGP02_19485 [Mycobacteriales bacterium]|nr:hypothetical protein [Mycobacteriales bacterium]
MRTRDDPTVLIPAHGGIGPRIAEARELRGPTQVHASIPRSAPA